jgi:hypothetical protein
MKLLSSLFLVCFLFISKTTNITKGEMVLTQYGGDDFGSSSADYSSSSADYGAATTDYGDATTDYSAPTEYSSNSNTDDVDNSKTDDSITPTNSNKHSDITIPKEAKQFITHVAKGIIKGALKKIHSPKKIVNKKRIPKKASPKKLAPKKVVPKKPKSSNKKPNKKTLKKQVNKPIKNNNKNKNKKPTKRPSKQNLRKNN